MAAIRIQEEASHRPDDSYRSIRDQWGCQQTDRYIMGLFVAFGKIEIHGVASRSVPAEFGVDGYFFQYERHFVYLRRLGNVEIDAVTILHERMHRIGRFREDFGS